MNTQRFSYALLGGLGLLLALQGCGDDDDKNPTPPVIGDAGSGGSNNTSGSGGKSGGGKSGGGTDNQGGTDSTTGGDDNTGAVGGEGGAAPFVPECNLPELGEDGCFNCPENGESLQFLNRCLDTDCEPFDNDRLPQLEDDGSLPALP